MKQLSIFTECTTPPARIKQRSDEWQLFIDGASRHNPGLAGAGVCLKKKGKTVFKEGFFLGTKTNNQAEYLALIIGLFFAKQLLEPEDILYIMSDSELLIKQVKGEYKVRDKDLAKLYQLAFLLIAGINYSFCHILREYNETADALANEGIDKKKKVPAQFAKFLAAHEIHL
jgi:ribonuclease HI